MNPHTSNPSKYLHSYFRNKITYNWKFGLILIFLVGIPRFYMVLQTAITQNYGPVSYIFMLMWFLPFIFLNKDGLRYIGFRKPQHYGWLTISFLSGIIASFAIYGCFQLLFGSTISNSFQYIAGTNAVPEVFTPELRRVYFLIGAGTSMIFSPIGEEFFFRGLIHGSFVIRFGEQNASRFDSLAFALTHLAHFGIVYTATGFHFLPVPALVWVSCMYLLSRLFFLCKQRSGSLAGPILSHAGYNVAMMYIIFYMIL